MFENINERISESEEEAEAEVTLTKFSFGLYILVIYFVSQNVQTVLKSCVETK